MKAAFATWHDRIAPVFDVAHEIHIVETERGRIVREVPETLPDDLPVFRARRLAELGVDLLVCGAVSRPLQTMILAGGVQVIPFVAGELRRVIDAWLSGDIEREDFAMPGCCDGRRHRRRREPGADQNGPPRRRSRRGGAGDPGQGPGGRTPGIGSLGQCICLQCGCREDHLRGVPCSEHRCPQCGGAMNRA